MEQVEFIKFLGQPTILSWTVNTSGLVKKAQQRLHILRMLEKGETKDHPAEERLPVSH